MGLILHVLVHMANIQDQEGGKLLLEPLKGLFPRLKLIWADSAYKKGGFAQWVKELLGWEVEIVEHPLEWDARILGEHSTLLSIGNGSAPAASMS